ncbi:MAG: glycosyl hydrolase 53 family protein [Spirochaetales bacterium]|nr:glycosyl hydrolase 53 family protein [Spirochaetales bacterium]
MKHTLIAIITVIFITHIFTSCSENSAADVMKNDTIPNKDIINFIKGFDASYVDWYEEKYNVRWKDIDDTEKDFIEILKSHGVNTIRLRIWNNPDLYAEGINDGDNTLARTIRMAKRIKTAGLDLMLDFHYSDTWADPGRQIVPKEWESLASVSAVANALSQWTTSVLNEIKTQANIVPKYVQVGNEINRGLLVDEAIDYTDNNRHERFRFAGRAYKDENETNFSTDTFTTYLKAGADAVRAFDSSINIILHVASDGWHDWGWFFDPIKKAGVPFDVIGYSYYPWESNHGTIAILKKTIDRQIKKYGVKIIIAECSAHWHDDSDDGYAAQHNTYTHLIDPDTGSVYTDLTTADSGTVNYVCGTPTNQANIIRHIMKESRSAGASGILIWGGDLYGTYTWGRFDSSSKALQSIREFE